MVISSLVALLAFCGGSSVIRARGSLEIARGWLSKPLPLAKWRGQGVILEESLGGILDSAGILQWGSCPSASSEDSLDSVDLGSVDEEEKRILNSIPGEEPLPFSLGSSDVRMPCSVLAGSQEVCLLVPALCRGDRVTYQFQAPASSFLNPRSIY